MRPARLVRNRVVTSKQLFRAFLIAAMCLVEYGSAHAQTYPSRPITLLLYAPSGGILDVVARSFEQKINPRLGQPIVIMYKPGGNGAIAADALVHAAPDGYTLLFDAIFNHTVLPHIQKLGYDPVNDFQPITTVFSAQIVLAVPKSLPVQTAAELAAYAKTKQGGLSYGSQGNGSTGHILGNLFQSKSDAPMTHVPYKGANLLQTDLITGRLDFGFISYSTAQPQLKDLRILAIASPRRWSEIPEVPTMSESGYPGVDFDTWFAVLAPRGTPGPIVERLRQEFQKAGQDKDLVAQLSARGLFVKTSTPAEVSEMISLEAQKVDSIINRLHLAPN